MKSLLFFVIWVPFVSVWGQNDTLVCRNPRMFTTIAQGALPEHAVEDLMLKNGNGEVVKLFNISSRNPFLETNQLAIVTSDEPVNRQGSRKVSQAALRIFPPDLDLSSSLDSAGVHLLTCTRTNSDKRYAVQYDKYISYDFKACETDPEFLGYTEESKVLILDSVLEVERMLEFDHMKYLKTNICLDDAGNNLLAVFHERTGNEFIFSSISLDTGQETEITRFTGFCGEFNLFNESGKIMLTYYEEEEALVYLVVVDPLQRKAYKTQFSRVFYNTIHAYQPDHFVYESNEQLVGRNYNQLESINY